MSLDKVREKIASMLSKTVENGATEDEAINAIKMAKSMMEKHGITLEDIKNRKREKLELAECIVSRGKYKNILDKFLPNVIAEYTNTTAFHIKRNDEVQTRFFGFRVDVELADFIYSTCRTAIEFAWNMHKVTLPQGSRAKLRIPFMSGAVDRLIDRIRKLSVTETGTELIVVKNQLIAAALSEKYKMNEGRTLPREFDFENEAYRNGYIAGDKINFNRSVAA